MTEENATKKTEATGRPAKPSLKVDWELYGEYLEASDLSDAEKRAFIETLWSIVVSFVDLGFGLHPTQQTCGEVLDLTSLLSGDVLGSDNPKSTFNTAGDTRPSAKGEHP